jgi:cytochrome c-type biogenesis protein CcmH
MNMGKVIQQFWLALSMFALALALAGPAVAIQPGEQLADPTLEARARTLSAGLRCLVCQNQSIDDSDAPLARDLRLLVRERLAAGDSDQSVKAFIVARYGEFVLLNPPLNVRTFLLWLSAPMVLLLGILGLWRMRRTASLTSVSALTQAERELVEAITKQK